MMDPCKDFLSDHEERGDVSCPLDPHHTEALRRRAAQAPEWWPLVRRKSGPDRGRDYLDHRPIHCGVGLLLQSVEHKEDDYGGYTLRQSQGTRVRYELSGDEVVLYAEVGGHEAVIRAHPWMRFRWPS